MSHFEYMVPDDEKELVESSRWCADGVNGEDENESGSDTWKEDPSVEHEPPSQSDVAASMLTEQAIFSAFGCLLLLESAILNESGLFEWLLQPL